MMLRLGMDPGNPGAMVCTTPEAVLLFAWRWHRSKKGAEWRLHELVADVWTQHRCLNQVGVSMLCGARRAITEREYTGAHLVCEAPHIGKRQSAKSVITMVGNRAKVLGPLEMLHRLTVVEPQPSTWRKQILGHGRPKNAKQAALDFVAAHPTLSVLTQSSRFDHHVAEAACMVLYDLVAPPAPMP